MMFKPFSRDLTPDEEEAIAAFMHRAAIVPEADCAARSDPAVLWLKAQLVRRWNSERRAQAPLDAVEPIQIVLGLVAAGLLLVWTLPPVARALSLIGL
jgi:hypothetical protein